MYRSFQTLLALHEPEVVFILGKCSTSFTFIHDIFKLFMRNEITYPLHVRQVTFSMKLVLARMRYTRSMWHDFSNCSVWIRNASYSWSLEIMILDFTLRKTRAVSKTSNNSVIRWYCRFSYLNTECIRTWLTDSAKH